MATLTIETASMSEAGQNVKVATVDGKLVFVIDPTVDLGLSSTGKMRCIANTGGFTAIPGNLKLNLYLGKKA